jgi:hypothetical protein
MAGRYIVAAGVTGKRHVQFPHQFQDILPETIFISGRMIRLIDAFVNGSAEMFDETAVNAFIHISDFIPTCQFDIRFHGNSLLFRLNDDIVYHGNSKKQPSRL